MHKATTPPQGLLVGENRGDCAQNVQANIKSTNAKRLDHPGQALLQFTPKFREVIH